MQSKANKDASAGAAAAKRIEQDLLPAWREAERGLESVQPIPASMVSDVTRVEDYMHRRDANLQELATAWRDADEARIDEAEKRLRALNEMGRDIRRLSLVHLPRR